MHSGPYVWKIFCGSRLVAVGDAIGDGSDDRVASGFYLTDNYSVHFEAVVVAACACTK